MRPIFIISEENPKSVELLQEGLAGLEEVTVICQKANQLLKLEQLDAVYMSATAAERWGPVPVLHKAEVLKTTPVDKENGYPPYVIAGGIFDLEDPHQPSFELPIIVNSVLEAVESFNSTDNPKITKVAFWSDDLCVPRINPTEAGRIIKAIYEERLRRSR